MVDTTNVIRLPETGAWEGVPRLENGWRPTGGAVNPGADEGLLNWPLQVLAARDRVLKDRVDLLSQRADVEVTVGAGGQFATINEALAHLSERRPGYVSGGFQARVRLRPGFVMREQVAVSGVNLGWIRLVSSDAEVQIDRSYLTANIGGRYPAFSARSGGQLPVIDTLFSMMSTGAAAGRDGIFVFDGGAVTVVIPSTLRRPHALRCITAVLRGTAHPRFRVHVAVSQAEPLDETQREAARRIEAHSNAEVTWLRAERFNFSWVNNRVIERTDGENVLLLNDDVSPTAPDWLDWMAAYLADPAVGVVGARLLYPGGAVQHGGVIMGLAGLCDHAHRHLPGNQPGYAWRAVLPQELSAVTAACMLVRRRLLREVGGLDEAYPSAFNDVDLALRVREAGYAVIYAPQAELIHHELQTYGSHYAGDRQPFFTMEGERMRARWADVCAADPFHNPNLGLEPGREWHLAFPPRVDLSG